VGPRDLPRAWPPPPPAFFKKVDKHNQTAQHDTRLLGSGEHTSSVATTTASSAAAAVLGCLRHLGHSFRATPWAHSCSCQRHRLQLYLIRPCASHRGWRLLGAAPSRCLTGGLHASQLRLPCGHSLRLYPQAVQRKAWLPWAQRASVS
jgi:hypothetical protein